MHSRQPHWPLVMPGILLVLFLPVTLIGCAPASPAVAAATDVLPTPLPIYYLGPDDAIRRALTLTEELTLVDDLDQARAIVLNDYAPSPAESKALVHAWSAEGKGLVLLLGPELEPFATRFSAVQSWLRIAIGPAADHEPRTLEPVADDDPLLREVNWNSAPQVRERSAIGGADLAPLVRVYQSDEAVLGMARNAMAPIFVVGAWLGEDYNPAFRDWPYFNYLIYHLACRAGGGEPLSYADYPASPVPHRAERAALVALVVLMLATTVGAFLLVRRYSLRHPEALTQLVADPERYVEQEKETAWEEIGFHRPLGGFLFLLAVGLFLFVPLIIYQNVILYGWLLPSAQARGAWSLVVNFFNTFWLLFDWGTSTAFVKFFSEHRVKRPEEGLKYVQLFVWWQAITGTIQLGAVALAAATFMPQTANAYLSWYLVAHALIQFPGFLRVYQYTFRAFQRLDYDQVLNLVIYMAPIPLQALTVFLMTRWGEAHPAFGGAMGGVLGLGLGVYLVEIATFLVGFWLYKRLGLASRVIFLAHFDWQTVKSALSFGFPITVAGVIGSLGYTVQVTLTMRYILNYAEVQGNWDVVSPNGLILAFSAVNGMYYGLMPAISEAWSHGRRQLSQYYVAQGFKWGGFVSGFVASVLLGTGGRFILGALGEEYTRAAQMMTIMALWGAVQFPAWFADRLQEGVGRPALQAWMLLFEQTLRIVLMFLLLPRFQLLGLIMAYCVALPAKDIVAWIVNHKLIVPLRLYLWQTIVAPTLAAALNYLVLWQFGNWIWSPAQVPSVILFVVGLVFSFPLYAFFSGLLGGWDEAGLEEFRRSVGLASLAKPYAWLIYHGCRLGARISPLHGRFPIDLYEAAEAEAASLTAEKVALA